MTTAPADTAERRPRPARTSRSGQYAALPPRLRVLTPPIERARRIPFQGFCIGLLALGLVTLLGMNVELSQGSYNAYSLQKEQQQLNENVQRLTMQVQVAQSPQQVSARAKRLGMVPSGDPVFVQLSDGKVIGVPAKAGTQALPAAADLPTALSVSPKEAAAAAAAQAQALQAQRYLERLFTGTAVWPTDLKARIADAGRPASPATPPSPNGSQSTPGAPIGDGAVPVP